MTNPFDDVVAEIKRRGFHNHRLEEHSTLVNRALLRDLRESCPTLRKDLDRGVVRSWSDMPSPGGRARKLDFIFGEPRPGTEEPDLAKMRICMENKSVVTAHRNRTNRFDDLDDVRSQIHKIRPEAILVATVMVGLSDRVLNVPDRVKPFVKNFETVRLRLSKGDSTLWKKYPHAVSKNRPTDPQRTVDKFRDLPVRGPGHTHEAAYDFVLLVPVFIDNVNPPRVARKNNLGLAPDLDYQAMLTRICKAYTARWHLE